MKVLFASKPYSLGSWIIKLFTFSKFSHVAVKISEELIVDSTLLTGVRCISLDEFREHYPNFTEVNIELPNEIAAINFVLNQVGKPYDWTALLGMVLQRKWHEEDSWFCNELWEAAAKASGKPRFRDDVHRITPQQSWAVL